MTYEIFTSNLKNLKRMKSEYERLKDRLSDLIYLETGVKGVSYDSVMVSHNPSLSALKRLEMIDVVDDLCREINFLAVCITETETILGKMPKELQTMLNEKYARGWSYERLGEKYGYSKSGMIYKLIAETERYL